MRKGNVTILASIFAMLMVAGAVGAGTLAYFSDVESTLGNTITAGTLNMEIKDSDEGYVDETPISASMSSPHDLKPGEEFWTDVIFLKNVGSLDAQYVYVSFGNLGGNSYLSKKIVLVDIWEYSPNMNGVGGDQYNPFDATTADSWLGYWGAPQDGSISLHDIVAYGEPGGGSAKTSFRLHTGDEGDPPDHTVYPYLPVGGVVKIRFKFKLLESTDNRAQGQSCTFDVKFIASNCLSGTDLDASF